MTEAIKAQLKALGASPPVPKGKTKPTTQRTPSTKTANVRTRLPSTAAARQF